LEVAERRFRLAHPVPRCPSHDQQWGGAQSPRGAELGITAGGGPRHVLVEQLVRTPQELERSRMLGHRHEGLAEVVVREHEQLDVAALVRDLERLTADEFSGVVVAKYPQRVAAGREDEALAAPIAELLDECGRDVEML